MELIDNIINELMDGEKSVTSPLLKTKVLASRLQNESLLSWVTNELKGYNDNDEIPKYRVFKANVTGTYINIDKQYNNQPVYLSGIDEEILQSITEMKLTHSAASLESYKDAIKTGILEWVFPAELTGLIESNWRRKSAPYLRLINCRKSISINAADEVLSNIRNSLLDFMLKIDAEFGHITTIKELKQKEQQIITFMSQTINTTGDGNIINTGDHSKIDAKIKINKGNKDELKDLLKQNGISEDEIIELIEVIDEELPDTASGRFGKKVNQWTKKMLDKALDGSWQIGIGAAGNLLGEAIKTYYGM